MKRLYIFLLLLLFVLLQVGLFKGAAWSPDLIVLMVVFIGIFRGTREALVYGLIAGFLRGCFSEGTIYLDILLFPLAGMVSSILGRMFYRQNPAVQALNALIVMVLIMFVHTAFLNITSGNDIPISFVYAASWRRIAVTVLVSPFVFSFLAYLLRLEDQAGRD